MICLHCGDCCKRMSPFSSGEPCPNLVSIDGYYFCKEYYNRPNECVTHRVGNSVLCPIGIDVLDFTHHLGTCHNRTHEAYSKLIKLGLPTHEPLEMGRINIGENQ